jgi:hypothetical protein
MQVFTLEPITDSAEQAAIDKRRRQAQKGLAADRTQADLPGPATGTLFQVIELCHKLPPEERSLLLTRLAGELSPDQQLALVRQLAAQLRPDARQQLEKELRRRGTGS